MSVTLDTMRCTLLLFFFLLRLLLDLFFSLTIQQIKEMNDTESHNIPIEKNDKEKHIKKCFIYIFVKDFHLLIKQNNWILGKEKRKKATMYILYRKRGARKREQSNALCFK